jgi:hypothetical protein
MTKSKSVKKRSNKRRLTNKRNLTNKRRTIKKKRISNRKVSIFDKPKLPDLSDSVFNHDNKNSGNIIPGLRNHLRK